MASYGRNELLKVIVLGDSSVGKTSLMNRWVQSKFSLKYKATIGADFLTKDINIDDKNIQLQIWDTCGQERFANLGDAFYRGANACILVFDISARKTFESLDAWIDNFIENASPSNEDEFPFIIFGNKSDLPVSDYEISESDARSWCKSYNHNNGNGIPFYLTSAKENVNVDVGFRKIAKVAMKYNIANNKKYSAGMQPVDLNKNKSGSKDCKCQLL